MKEVSFDELAAIFEQAGNDIEKEVMRRQDVSSEDLLSLSGNLVPLDEGGLMESGSVEPSKKEGNEIVARVGYNKEYALKMHEDIYTAKVSGRGRKYLEKPTTENAEKYTDFIGKSSEDVFK
jgi:hypothetical protein